MRQAGRRIFRRLVGQSWYQAATRVALFAAIRNEPDLEAVLNDCNERGARCAYPRVRGEGLQFSYVSSIDELIPGAFGVPEPRQGGDGGEGDGDGHGDSVAIADLDLVLTPGLVFDVRGGRIGYGKGFYDRAFGQAAFGQAAFEQAADGPLRVAVCWDHQVLPSDQRAPTHSGDAPLDAIVTERRVVVCSDRLPPPSAADRRDPS